MLPATSSSLGANTDIVTDQSPSPSLLPSTNYLCNSCRITFENGQEQRAHMKEQWHLHNLKRRIENLPPTPRDQFDEVEKQNEKNADISQPITPARSGGDVEEEWESGDTEDEITVSPFQCLFCSVDFANNDSGFESNTEHMKTDHGMLIPDPETIEDIQGLVGYLATEIHVWHECIYCGATKPSTSSIQSHMRDKGHCRLNLDREPELLDFWESPDRVEGDNIEHISPTYLSETEMRFPSGKLVASRKAPTSTKKAFKKRDSAQSAIRALPSVSDIAESPTTKEDAQPAPGRQLARRDEMSIIGVSLQGRRALVLAEKKAQRSEAVARRAREWAYAKGANSQKFDQLENQMKWGKQNHKLLPR